MNNQFKIISNLEDLPAEWEEVVACKNILLSKDYFEVLEYTKPENMVCYAVAFYKMKN